MHDTGVTGDVADHHNNDDARPAYNPCPGPVPHAHFPCRADTPPTSTDAYRCGTTHQWPPHVPAIYGGVAMHHGPLTMPPDASRPIPTHPAPPPFIPSSAPPGPPLTCLTHHHISRHLTMHLEWEEATCFLEHAFEASGWSSQDVSRAWTFLNATAHTHIPQIHMGLQNAQQLLRQSKNKGYYKVLSMARDADQCTIKKAS